MKLKVCGMKYNTDEVTDLQPDYLGFIFWEQSPRFFDKQIPSPPPEIKKIGVFVDAGLDEVLEKIEKFQLQGVQLHGKETPQFCQELSEKSNALYHKFDKGKGQYLKIIKVFSIKDDFDFGILEPYEKVCDFYLFDTKGRLPGGNGYTFDWKLLKDYPSTKPFFLSGGVGLQEVGALKEFAKRPESKYCYAIDVNSRFEIKPGLKDVEKLRLFKQNIENWPVRKKSRSSKPRPLRF